MSEEAGKVNQYLCEQCGHRTTTINAVAGTTPFLITCRAVGGCDGMARSQFYRVDQQLRPDYEWYRPEGKELKKLDAPTRDHVRLGGLVLRKLDAVGRERHGYRLRRG